MAFNILDPLCRSYKKGDPGPPGPAPVFLSASAHALPYGQQPTLVISGTSPNLSMSIGIPAGQPGGTAPGGAGDVVGPASSTAGKYAVFADATGKLLVEGPAPFNGVYSSLFGIPAAFNPTNHASRHRSGGSDAIALHELAAPTSDVDLNNRKITNLGSPTFPSDGVNLAYLEKYAIGSSTPTIAGRVAVFADVQGKQLAQGAELAPVAFSGSYNDLSDTPGNYSLPTPNDLTAYLYSATDHFARTSDLPTGVGTGDVVGPASSTDGVMALFDGVTGKLLKTGAVPFNGVYASLSGIPSTFSPVNHAVRHKSGGADPIALNELAAPSAAVDFNSKQITNVADSSVAKSAVNNDRMAAYAVQGSASSVDGGLMAFDGTGGKKAKAGPVLGNAALLNVGITPGTVAAGDDPRFGLLPEPEVKHLVPYARKTGQGVYDLEYVYGLNWRNGIFQLKDLYQLADAQVKFAKVFSWFAAAGKTTAWVMDLRHAAACHNEAVLQGHTQSNWGSGRIDSRNHVLWKEGHYLMNYGAVIDGGKYSGMNSSGTYQGSLGTVLIMDKDNWQDDSALRLLHRPSTLDSTSIWNAYQENIDVRDFRYEGLCNWLAHDPGYVAAGLGLFRSGENATIDRIFSTGFNGFGILNIGPTPLNAGHLSVFGNTYGGFGHLGGALSTMNIEMLSGDDNPALFRVDSCVIQGDEMRAGGAVNINAIKSETGKRDPQRGQLILDADGHTGLYQNEGADLNLNIDVAQYDCTAMVVDSLFVMNGFTENPQPRGTTSANRAGRISVGSLQARNYRTVMHDIDRKQRWGSDGDFVKFGFKWNARLAGDAALWTPPCDLPAPLTRSTVNSQRRLGLVGSGGSFNYAAGTPAYNEETVTPIVVPTSNFQAIYAAVNKGIVSNGGTAQCKAISIDYELRTMAGAPVTWSIQSGPATISGTGLVTATGVGDVVIKAQGAGGAGYCYMKVIA